MHRTVFRCLLLLLLSIGFTLEVHAQQQITILNADRAEGGIIDGEPVRKLIGNVRLTTDQMEMDADSAYQFETRNLIQAFNIQIISENDIIWADTLHHDTYANYSEFRGRVILQAENNILYSEAIDYDRILDLAIFNSPIRFEDDQGTLTAREGHYFQNRETGFFRGDVQVADSTQYLEADSLFMNRSAEFYRLYANVYAEDFQEKVTLAGDFLEVDSTGHRLLDGNAWMMQINDAETDTSFLTSRTIHLTETDTSEFVDAYGEVEIWSEEFAAIADTTHYRSDLEQFQLSSSPVAWHQRIQLTGPYIEALLEDDRIKHLVSYTRPIAVMEDSATGRLNQMRGDTLEAFFENGEIDKITVFDNSELIFHLKDDDGNPDGLIELIAEGASIITFNGGELDNFKANRNIEGSHLPENPENIDRQLPDFRWDPELKPEPPQLRTARLPPIPDERPFEFPERYLHYMEENGMIP